MHPAFADAETILDGRMQPRAQVLVRVGGQNKTADLRYRVMFEEWRIPLRVKYLSGAAVSIEQILNAINLSGFVVGIGEWRPERKGQFGMFHVEGV